MNSRTSKRTRSARSRGAATLEAVVALPFFVLIVVSVLYMRNLYTVQLRTHAIARSCSWRYSAAGCDADAIPEDCRKMKFEDGPHKAVPENVRSAVLSAAQDMRDRARGGLAGVVVDLLEPVLVNQLSRSAGATAADSVPRPALYGGKRVTLSSTHGLPCNLIAKTPEEWAENAFRKALSL